MSAVSTRARALLLLCALLLGLACGGRDRPVGVIEDQRRAVALDPAAGHADGERRILFGDLHVHTGSFSISVSREIAELFSSLCVVAFFRSRGEQAVVELALSQQLTT